MDAKCLSVGKTLNVLTEESTLSYRHVSGKGLGGSSAVNAYMYHRPGKTDIDGLFPLTVIGSKVLRNLLLSI